MEDKLKKIWYSYQEIGQYVSADTRESFIDEIQTLIDQEVKKARIDEVDRARANTRPRIWYGTNIKHSAVADSYLIDRLAELESNK